MEQQRSVQTAFRFRPDLNRRAKLKAKFLGISLNSYVESLIERDLSSEDKCGELKKKLKGYIRQDDSVTFKLPLLENAPEYTGKDLDADPRLEYLAGKYLR